MKGAPVLTPSGARASPVVRPDSRARCASATMFERERGHGRRPIAPESSHSSSFPCRRSAAVLLEQVREIERQHAGGSAWSCRAGSAACAANPTRASIARPGSAAARQHGRETVDHELSGRGEVSVVRRECRDPLASKITSTPDFGARRVTCPEIDTARVDHRVRAERAHALDLGVAPTTPITRQPASLPSWTSIPPTPPPRECTSRVSRRGDGPA